MDGNGRETYQCPVSNCSREFDTNQGRGIHLGSTHSSEEVRQLLINDARAVEAEIGSMPTTKDLCDRTRWTSATIYKYVDKWGEVERELGYDDTHYDSTPQITTDALIADIRRLHDELDRVPRTTDMEHEGNYSTGTYHYRFDTWSEAVREAGFKPVWQDNEAFSENIYYGPNFAEQRERALERDGHECQACSMHNDEHLEEVGTSLHIHHIMEARSFIPDDGRPDYDVMNDLDNLITLCASCHKTLEGEWQDSLPHEFARLAQLESENEQSVPTAVAITSD